MPPETHILRNKSGVLLCNHWISEFLSAYPSHEIHNVGRLPVLNRLVQIAETYSVDVLSVVFDAILTMIGADKEAVPEAESEVAPLIMNS